MFVGRNVIPTKHLKSGVNEDRLSYRSSSHRNVFFHTFHEAGSLRNGSLLNPHAESARYHSSPSSSPFPFPFHRGIQEVGYECDLSYQKAVNPGGVYQQQQPYSTVSHFKFSVPEDLTQTLKIRRSRYKAYRERLYSQHVRNYIAALEKSLEVSKQRHKKFRDCSDRNKTAELFLALINRCHADTVALSTIFTDIPKTRNLIKNFISNLNYLPLMMLMLDFYRRKDYISSDILRQHYQQLMPYNFTHCPLCVLDSSGLLQEYAKDQEQKHRRKIILPCVIPWEYGSNKFASQKGTGGFGAIRNATINVKSSRNLSESNDGVVPWINCPPLRDKELASQAGLTPFGNIREHVTKVHEKDGDIRKDISKIVDTRASEGFLKIWSQPNPDAKIDQPFGKLRDAITQTKGGRRFSQAEINASRAAIPKFQDPRETIAAKAQKAGEGRATGYISNRRTITQVEGLNRTEQDELDSTRYMAWIGGQLTLQSQSRTGEFLKPRDVVSTSYFDRVMSEREFTAMKAKLDRQRMRQEKKDSSESKKDTLKYKFGNDSRERDTSLVIDGNSSEETMLKGSSIDDQMDKEGFGGNATDHGTNSSLNRVTSENSLERKDIFDDWSTSISEGGDYRIEKCT